MDCAPSASGTAQRVEPLTFGGSSGWVITDAGSPADRAAESAEIESRDAQGSASSLRSHTRWSMGRESDERSEAEVRAWTVRAGSRGESEQWNLENYRASVGWGEIPDLGQCHERADVAALVEAAHPQMSSQARAAATGQLWAFGHVIAPGDIVVMPMKTESGMISIGRCTGPYEFDPAAPADWRHRIPVTWRDERVARVAFGADLLPSLNGLMTVYGLKKNEAVARLTHLLADGVDPGGNAADPTVPSSTDDTVTGSDVMDPEAVPTTRAIRDRVTSYVAEEFAEHRLTHLVAEILEVLGYTCEVSRVPARGSSWPHVSHALRAARSLRVQPAVPGGPTARGQCERPGGRWAPALRVPARHPGRPGCGLPRRCRW